MGEVNQNPHVVEKTDPRFSIVSGRSLKYARSIVLMDPHLMPTYYKNRCLQFSTLLILSDFPIMASMEKSQTLKLNLTLVHREFRHQIFNISLLE